MDIDFPLFDNDHLLGESATHPIEPRCGTLAALLRLAGRSPQRCHVLPAHRSAAHSDASNCRFQVQIAFLTQESMRFLPVFSNPYFSQ